MYVASVILSLRHNTRTEVLSAVDQLMRHLRSTPGSLGCRLLAEANDADALVLVSEWATRDALETFLTSREFTVLQGMRILLRKDPETVLDEVVGRATMPLARAHAKF